MKSRCYPLSPHHVFSLVAENADGYANLVEGLRKQKIGINGARRIAYTEDDVLSTRAFYLEVSSNPENMVIMRGGSDGNCKKCSNYDGHRCTLFTNEELALQNARDLENFIKLGVREKAKIADLLPLAKKLKELSEQAVFDVGYY